MDPISLFFLFGGFKTAEELMVKLGLTQNTVLQPMKYNDYKPNETLINVIAATEGVQSKAYKLSGESRYTIGYGTTYIYSANGSLFRGNALVRSTDTLSVLKMQMGYGSMTDLQFAKQLKINHIKYDPSMANYKKVFSALDSAKVPFDENVAISLIDYNYNSGSGLKGIYFTAMVNGLIQQKNDLKKIASVIANVRISYLKSVSNWKLYNHGWLKRVYFACMRIVDNSLTYSSVDRKYGSKTAENVALLKIAFRDQLGIIITY